MKITAPSLHTEVDLTSVDLFDPASYQRSCQHHVWQALRREAPVWRQRADSGAGFWSVTRYAECNQVLRDSRTFSSAHGTVLASVGVGDSAGGSTITLMDPPEHTAIRVPAMRLLGHSAIRARRIAIRDHVVRIIQPLLDNGAGDFAVAMRGLPMAIFGDIMGVPDPLREGIAHWAMVSIAPDEPEFRAGATVADTMRNAHHELFALLSESLRYSRRHPADDLLTALSGLRLDGKPLGDRRILLNCYSYVLGAQSTTPQVAAQTLLAIIERPDVGAALASQPERLPALVDEGVRWTSPTHHLVRRVTRRTSIAGQMIEQGDWVCAWLASANRDVNVFTEPYEFRPDRRPNPHLGFGVGPHFCIGSQLSREALTALFEYLCTDSLKIQAAGDPTHLCSNWINGLTHLPVTIRRAAL